MVKKGMEVMKEREVDQLWIEIAKLKLRILQITERIKEHKLAKSLKHGPDHTNCRLEVLHLEKMIREQNKVVAAARLHYAIETRLSGATFESLGIALGVSPGRANQIWKKAIIYLKQFDKQE